MDAREIDDVLEHGRLRRLGRLSKTLPNHRRRMKDRRKDDDTRASVDDVPPGTDPEVLERRRAMVRREQTRTTDED